METAVTPPPESELNLLMDWTEPGRNARIGRSAAVSIVVHIGAIIFLLVMPETLMQPARPKELESLVTPLYFTPITLTQKESNPTKTVREFRSPDLSPRLKAPPGPTPEPREAAPKKGEPAPPPAPKPPASLPDPPKLEIAPNENPKLVMPVQQAQVPQPRSPFEDVKPVTQVPPDQRVLDANGQGGGRSILSGPGGVNSQGNSPFASSGAEMPQLLSDPKGVDFKPYLAAVLASVKRSWLMIMPKNSRRGYVSVQFAILRDGSIRKAAFAQQTGDPSMDNTAIMAISQAGPFGPLPVQYHDAEIHVQINFSYNQPRQ